MAEPTPSGARRLASGFWRWYERHYTVHVGITAFLFLSQIIHLAWLAGDVVIFRITGVSVFPVSPSAQFLLALVDYLEIPALASATVLYIFDFRRTRSLRAIGLLALIQAQWFHLFWITDEFVVSTIRRAASVSSTLPTFLVWVAIIIDYLELPVIVSTLRRFFALVGARNPLRAAAQTLETDHDQKRPRGSPGVWPVLVVAAIMLVGALLLFRVTRDRPHTAVTLSSATLPASQERLRVGNQALTVEVARTPEEQQRGLMEREVLPEDVGMLFPSERPEQKVFWMKNTRIPLDMLWIRDGVVIGMTPNVQPEPGVGDEDLRRYPSPGAVTAVLEVNGGWAERHNVRTGDRVTAQH